MSSVVCSSCGLLSVAGNKFCADCGTAFPSLCSACGGELIPGKKFCPQCGTPIESALTSRVAAQGTPDTPASTFATVIPQTALPPQEERRLVTALFCDLVGFTPLAASLDPEEVREIQSAYFAAMADQVARYGGTVEKYAGDAVLALFGAPIAHEDDAERAVLCALEMQGSIEPVAASARSRWKVEPSIRVGVNTGEVVSGTWTASGRQDVAVTGDAVNTAARIQAVADGGEVLVGTETMRLTRRRIRYGPVREVSLKGKLGSVPLYPALGLRERFGERWETSDGATPLVGRDRELVHLLDAWVRAQGGDGGLVTLIGDAGVGKSRLLAEVIGKVSAGTAVRVVRARCPSYGQSISLWLVADLLRSLFGIGEGDGLTEIRTTLGTALPELLSSSDAHSQAEAIDVLGEVLGLPAGESIVAAAGPQIRRQALLRSLKLVLRALAERAPSVLVLEDVHWVDAASREVLTEILGDVPGLRLLALAAQRPGTTAPWTHWGWTERITVRPLGEHDAALLAGAVLHGMPLSRELVTYVGERAGGNPFFVEELLRALEESGGLVQRDGSMALAPGAAERLPSTLTEILLARLDRLEGGVRRVAQVASVIGRTFAVRLLAQVMEREQVTLELPLSALQGAEIAFPSRGSDLEYMFKHVTMREAAYNTLVQKRRQQLHLDTARAIAALYPSDEYVEIIAYHYGKTQEHGEAAQWLEKAGDRAASQYANGHAEDYYRQALERLSLTDDVTRLHEKLGLLLCRIGKYEEARTLLEATAASYQAADEWAGLVRVTPWISWVYGFLGTPGEGIAPLRSLLERLEQENDTSPLCVLYGALGRALFRTGQYEEALVACDRAIDLAPLAGEEWIGVLAEWQRVTLLIALGRLGEAWQAGQEALPRAELLGDWLCLTQAHRYFAEIHIMHGALDMAQEHVTRALASARALGGSAQLSLAIDWEAWIALLRGEWRAARASLEEALALNNQVGGRVHAAYIQLQLAHLCLVEGDWVTAASVGEEAMKAARRSEDLQGLRWASAVQAELEILEGRPEVARARLIPLLDRPGLQEGDVTALLPVLAWAQLEMGQVNEAADTVTEVLQRARPEAMRLVLVEALRVQALVALRQERWAEAARSLEEGLTLARSISYPYAEARLLRLSAEMHLARGEHDLAHERFSAALALFHTLGARRDAAQVERDLAALVPDPPP